MNNPTAPRKSHSVPVIAYPEGVIVGSVRSGKNGKGILRHVATTKTGQRIGTFDMYREASDALLSWHRKGLDELRTHEVELTDAPEPIRVELVECPAHRAGYGIRWISRYVFRTTKGSSPTRIVVWSNLDRPNPRNGEPVRFTDYGPRDGGNGRYLDPQNKATDDEVSVLMSPEASVLSAHGDSTGTEASGQVYLPSGARIPEGAAILLVWPDGTQAVYAVRFTNNGHGRLVPDSFDAEQISAGLGYALPTTTAETTEQRRERLAGELVAETLAASSDHRYARAYGILAGLVRGSLDDGAEGQRSAALAREYVRQMDASARM